MKKSKDGRLFSSRTEVHSYLESNCRIFSCCGQPPGGRDADAAVRWRSCGDRDELEEEIVEKGTTLGEKRNITARNAKA